ncbi:hypothetical protein EYF80_006001 [Liparis tanakae]|uniref:Uncharacterized protein n=1 Tax=Liparis tanakae TaxID=230148 RepID=A0A4Z2J0G9_9TELE|nr:hypothetical protein EYF80_006001 [Liparis tanakae]
MSKHFNDIGFQAFSGLAELTAEGTTCIFPRSGLKALHNHVDASASLVYSQAFWSNSGDARRGETGSSTVRAAAAAAAM